MARNRMVKSTFWDDEKIASLSMEARLFFIGLWTHSDDFGVVKGNATWLRNQIFPYDVIKIEKIHQLISELEKIGCIISFSKNQEDFFYIRNFLKHQRIDRPSTTVRNPAPPLNILEEKRKKEGKKRRNFKPPAVKEVDEYCQERKNGIDAAHFINWYQARGWKTKGGEKVEDWKACVRTWEKNKKKESGINADHSDFD